MTPLWDAVLREPAEMFLSSLSPEDATECREVILNDLCNNPDRRETPSFPNRPGVIERSLKGWHFRYGIENANTIAVFSIHYAPDNPKSPMFGLFPTDPPPPSIQ